MAEFDTTGFFQWPTAKYHSTTYPFIDPTRPELSTKGKTAIVSGAGYGGIGYSIAISLAKSGISALGLLGRTESTLLQTKSSINEISPDTNVFIYIVDIRDTDTVLTAFGSFTISTGSKIDILGANAGYMPHLTSITEADPVDWWQTFEINIKGNFNLLRAYVPHAARDGIVVHTSSSSIHIPYMSGYSAYRGSKAGATKVFDLFKGEMAELGNGVRVIQFHPGLINTTMSEKFGESVKDIPFDDATLSGDFFNWIVSDEAKLLDGKFVAANWNAEELAQKQERIAKDKHLFTMDLVGWREKLDKLE
ncbi:hypothetical protein TruAng_008704 [Truncatella angustata]|nr:hypothetical protein TruAng_008704 [Truncatella angustata]